MNPRGRAALIALEGIDGAGKSTVLRALAQRLSRRGWRVGTWREPSDPALGREAQRIAARDPLRAALKFTLDRALARPQLQKLLGATDVVLTDRSMYSTLAYQGSALPRAARSELARLQRSATVVPDRVVWLAVPISLALTRVHRRGARRAPLERARTLRRVDRGYRALARAGGWWRLDGRRTSAQLAVEAEAKVTAWLGRPRRRPTRRRG